MRNIDSFFLSELKAQASLPVVSLLKFVIGPSDALEEFYITTNDTDLAWDDKYWKSRAVDWANISLGSDEIVTNISFSIDDVNRELYPSFALSEPIPYELSLYLGVLNADYQVQSTILLFRGYIDLWGYEQTVLKVEASSLFNQWNRKTMRMFSGSCRWSQFKGPECKYVGEQTRCDRTYTECVAYGNGANFGGFRWLPRLQNKKIAWGKGMDSPDVTPFPAQ